MARVSTRRHKGVILHQQGLSQTVISKQAGVCAVQALLNKHKETGNIEVGQGNLVQQIKKKRRQKTEILVSVCVDPISIRFHF